MVRKPPAIPLPENRKRFIIVRSLNSGVAQPGSAPALGGQSSQYGTKHQPGPN